MNATRIGTRKIRRAGPNSTGTQPRRSSATPTARMSASNSVSIRIAAASTAAFTVTRGPTTNILEPRTAQPAARLRAIAELTKAGIPAGVMVAPVIPGLTDHELPGIIKAAAEAGAQFAGMVPLRLPYAVKNLFVRWLEEHLPARKEKVLTQIRAMRGGKLNESQFGKRMQGE